MNRFRLIVPESLCFLVLLLVRPPAAGGVIRVPHDIDSIQRAIDVAAYGDTILVEGARVYDENIRLKSRVLLRGTRPNRPVIRGNVVAERIEDATMENIIVEGDDGSLFDNGIYCTDAGVLFKNCESRNGYYGFRIIEESDVGIDSCHVESSWLDGILIDGSRAAISNTVVRENTVGPAPGNAYAVSILSGSRVELVSSRIVHNLKGIRVYNAEVEMLYTVSAFNGQDGLSLNPAADCDVDRCTISYNEFRDVTVSSGVSESEIKNSIIWNNHNSIFDQSGVPISYSVIPEPTGGTGNLTFFPLFVDGPNGDFRLQSNSRCIDRGEPLLWDPDGTRADIGAFFFDQLDYDPPPPSFISAIGDEQRVILSWPYMWETFLDHFTIYRSEVSGFLPGDANRIAEVEPREQSYNDAGLTNEVTYYYRITGVYQLGYESPPTEEIAATPGIAPELVIDPPRVDFGTVVAGSIKHSEVVLSNTGNGVLHVGNIEIPGFDVFAVDVETPFELQPGEERPISVRFQPPLPQPYSGRMEIAYTSLEGHRYVDLTGEGVAKVIALPNPFTPNGDGYNDFVTFDLPPHQRFDIRIFDITGREMRRIRTPLPNRWYGRTDGGGEAEPGLYIYIVATDGETVANGTIALIR